MDVGCAKSVSSLPNLDTSSWGLDSGFGGSASFHETHHLDAIPWPKELQPRLVIQDPQVTVFYDFLTSEEASHLVLLAHGRWQDGTRACGGDEAEQSECPAGALATATLDFSQTPIVARVEARVAAVT